MHHCRAFIFDMDGLIFDTERVNLEAWYCASEELGVPITEAVLHEMIGHSPQECRTIIARHLGLGGPVDALFEAADRHFFRMIAQNPMPIKEGVVELFDHLKSSGIPCAVATNSHTDAAKLKLNAAKLMPYVRGVVGVDQVSNPKPAPDVYLKAAALLEEEPKACLALEDSEVGLMSAHAAGMYTIVVPDLKAPTPAMRTVAQQIHGSLVEFLLKYRGLN